MKEEVVTLQDILENKEARKVRQDALREQYKLPIASISLNIPGNVKDTLILRRLCHFAVSALRRKLAIVKEESYNLKTGPEALLVVKGNAIEIKELAIEIEEEYSFGRLLDIDVFNQEGVLLSRKDKGNGRSCFVCKQSSLLCMRERKHTAAEINSAVSALLNEFIAYESRQISLEAERLGAIAVEAMLYEVSCTPSPGLVDRVNSGAHQDMDFYSFMASSAALSLTMNRCAQAGINHEGSLAALLPVLRLIGLEGEKAMFQATKGVNTQKGLVFLLGIIVASAGWVLKTYQSISATLILDTAAELVNGIVERELAAAALKRHEKLTAGEKLYLKYGVTGIRGELEAGLPAIRDKALPALNLALKQGLSFNDALVHTLIVLMTCVDDTTVMHRHQPDKMRVWVKERASMALAAGGMYSIEGRNIVKRLDHEFIEQNVSTGGVADLLAVTWFLHQVVL